MEDVTEANGKMENKMEKEHTFPVLDKKSMVNGNKERGLDGLAEEKYKINEKT